MVAIELLFGVKLCESCIGADVFVLIWNTCRLLYVTSGTELQITVFVQYLVFVSIILIPAIRWLE